MKYTLVKEYTDEKGIYIKSYSIPGFEHLEKYGISTTMDIHFMGENARYNTTDDEIEKCIDSYVEYLKGVENVTSE